MDMISPELSFISSLGFILNSIATNWEQWDLKNMIDCSLINIQIKAAIIYLILSIRYDRKSKILVTISYLSVMNILKLPIGIQFKYSKLF